jgi:glucose-1-phosphatase
MPTPKVVVFDLGKVLLDFDFSITARRIALRSKAKVDEAQLFIDQSPLLHRYEKGFITTPEFFVEICRLTSFMGTAEDFASCFADIFTPIPAMLDLHASLRRNGVPTYIFSNTNDLAILHIRERFAFFSHFDGYILSYEHGAMKPDAKLYEVVEKITRHRGTDIVYLDDRPENVAAGAERGWQALLHETPEKSCAALKRLGLADSL